MKLCPVCNQYEAVIHKTYGVLPCLRCKARRDSDNSNLGNLGGYPEFTTDSIRKGREEYASDMVQSHRSGQFSREYAELYPYRTKQMIKEGVVTKEEVRNSNYVWRGDIHRSWERNKKVDANMI